VEDYESVRKLGVPDKVPTSFEELARLYQNDSSFRHFQTHYQNWLSGFFQQCGIISPQGIVEFTKHDLV
jgi:hypothetical protein